MPHSALIQRVMKTGCGRCFRWIEERSYLGDMCVTVAKWAVQLVLALSTFKMLLLKTFGLSPAAFGWNPGKQTRRFLRHHFAIDVFRLEELTGWSHVLMTEKTLGEFNRKWKKNGWKYFRESSHFGFLQTAQLSKSKKVGYFRMLKHLLWLILPGYCREKVVRNRETGWITKSTIGFFHTGSFRL